MVASPQTPLERKKNGLENFLYAVPAPTQAVFTIYR